MRFGGTDTKYPLPYVANSYLSQSNELTITRILGESGFENSPAWLVVADMSTTYGGTVTESGMTLTVAAKTISTGWTFTTSADTAMANNTISATTVGNDVFVAFSGDQVSTLDWYNAIGASFFTTNGITVAGTSSAIYINSAGTTTFTLSADTVEAKGQYSGATLAVIRSKRNQITNQFYYTNENEITIGAISSALGSFMLSASTGPLTATTNSGYTVSLDETRDDYIVKILGKSPELTTDDPFFYVERIYPHFLREAVNRGDITGLNPRLVFTTEAAYTDFNDSYTNAITPWIVSRVIGSNVRRLFRFQTISDGDSSSNEIKISIANIDIVNHTFDVIVRNFSDTDATASSTALERWSNVSLNPDLPNYIAKVIGTTDESFPRKSMFITVDMEDNHPVNTVPAGFEGYSIRNSGISGITSANVYYKTEYFSGDSKFKTYLGLSELGYTSLTQNQVSVRNSVKSLEYDLFAYDGATASGMTQIKGFHMENIADPTQFVSGSKNSLTAYTNPASTLIDKSLLKFTVAPAGGFDGWDKYRQYEYPYEEFTDAYTDNVNAFKKGIDTMANPQEVDINLFATPGVDFSNNETIIKYALEMIEDRTDSLYIIDAPRLTVGTEKGTAEEVVSILESTGIDSNYAATYWPWVQLADPTSGKYSYQSPTFMVVKSIAYTDNIASPWNAPAGVIRGLAPTNVVRADIKLNKNQRDILYGGRVNPIDTQIQTGVVILGQKTLQVRQSALDRINVRRLLLQVRRLVAAASQTLLFEQNDQTLRDQFLAKVEPILLQIQNQRGLAAFKVVMDDSNNTNETIDRNTLVGKIQLKPTRTAEFIDLTFQVLPTGANFEDF
ncbi:MAG: hypothetical protein KatS3mg035_1109 [Bacteroidia bacterium]|nr:MAG: hypothetical protein KatS3mg035_1109 [Bacteroidia bacterium]